MSGQSGPAAAGGHGQPPRASVRPEPARARRPGPAERVLALASRLLLTGLLVVVAAFTLGARPAAETDLLGDLLRAALALTPVSPDRLSTPRLEFIANVLLFVPLGVALRPALPRVPLTLLLLVPVAATLGVEVLQLLVVVGRTPDPVDVAANTAGGAFGLLLGADLLRLARWWDARRR